MADEHSTRIDAYDAQSTEDLFENPSDNIFARIFTKVKEDGSSTEENCVPWKFCDIILSAIRDPRFNAKDVTFENCGEMLSRMASRRDEGWSKVAVRAHTTSSSGLPSVVLLGVLNILKDEMQTELDMERWSVTAQDFSHVPSRFSSVGFRAWRDTVRNIALVHPSWYIHARLLLGYAILARNGPSPNFIRNPLFGGWTRELHVSFAYNHVSGIQHSLLPTLCARVPNVRLVSFSISRYAGDEEILVQMICRGISVLERVEEVVFLGDAVPAELVPVLSKTRQATLRTVRLLLSPGIYRQEDKKIPQVISPLSSLPNLRLINVVLHGNHEITHSFANFGMLSAVSWHRTEGCTDFTLHHLCYEPRFDDLPEDTVRNSMLQYVRHAEFDLFILGPGSSGKTDNISAALSRACADHSFGCKLTLQKSRALGFGLAHFAECLSGVRLCPSVEELELITSLLPCMRGPNGEISDGTGNIMMKRVASDDCFLSEALAQEIIPSLRVVRVLLKEEMLSSRFIKDALARAASTLGEEISPDTQFTYLFPECRQKCKERGVELIVDILFEKESWH